MAEIRDPHGTRWSVRRKWWPFFDLSHLSFDLVELALALPLLLLWPFWLLTKVLGARWVILIERDGHETGRELVRGWRRSQGRIAEIVLGIAQGATSGRYVI